LWHDFQKAINVYLFPLTCSNSQISSTFKILIEECFAVHYPKKKKPATKEQALSSRSSIEPICTAQRKGRCRFSNE